MLSLGGGSSNRGTKLVDRLQAMQAFVAVVEAGSFTAAANTLGRSKSQISKQVSSLEQALGLQLLQRSTRQLSVSQAGQSYYRQLRLILENLHELEEETRDRASLAQGRLRVTAPVSYGTRCLSPLVTRFCQDYPGIALELDLSDRYEDLVQAGYDLALRIGALEDSSLIQRQLARLPFVYVASPAYLSGHAAITQPSDLSQHAGLIYTQRDPQPRWQFRDASGARLSVAPQVRLASNNGDILVEAALQGLGVAAVPRFFVEAALANGSLVALLEAAAPAPLSLVAVYPATRYLPRKARVFIDFLVAALSTS